MLWSHFLFIILIWHHSHPYKTPIYHHNGYTVCVNFMLQSQVTDLNEEMISMRTYMEEERLSDKYDRLEEHLNDFVELTQNELTNLKQEISNMEEKIDYQLEERTRDLQEALENANTRVIKPDYVCGETNNHLSSIFIFLYSLFTMMSYCKY